MPKTTSILQFADIHFGVEDRDAMAAVHDYALGLKPDLTLVCGDITQSGKIQEFKDARDWIREFPGLKLLCPGNHDTPMFGIFHRIFDAFGRYNRIIAPLSEPHYVDDNIMIVPMNTARGIQLKLDWSLGVVDLKELGALIKTLHTAPAGALKMLAVHHPFIYPDVSPLQAETKNGPTAIKALSDAGIDAVMSGHVHAPFTIDREPGKTQMLSIGTGTLSTRKRGKAPSFNHIEVTQKELKITAIDWIDQKFVAQKPWIKSRQELHISQTA